jgi:hypothetical protein
MSGLLRRLTRRRPATADETRSSAPESSEPAGAPADTPAEPGGGHPVPAPDDQATRVLPVTGEQPAAGEPAQPAPVRDLPAGIDPAELAVAPAASASRGKLRRRLRYLQRVRELLLRDLGGFIFEIHRTVGGTPQETHRRLVESKANRIAGLDAEIRGLEGRLGEPHEGVVLREPGIGGLCPECGELHASDAHYCARCGAPLDAKARARRDAAVAQPTTPTLEPAPASVLWASGPHPRAPEPPAEEAKADPSAATSQWLALPAKERDEPATTGAITPGDEPAVAAHEPTATNAITPGDEPLPPADEAATGDDAPPAAADDAPAAADDAPAATDEEAPAAAKPKRPRKPAGAKKKPAVENGRRDDDVPLPSGDPLGTRPEPGS